MDRRWRTHCLRRFRAKRDGLSVWIGKADFPGLQRGAMSETPWMFHQGVILFQTTFRTVGRPPSQPQPHQANAGGAYGAILDILCGRLLSACLFRASLCRVGNTSLFLPRPAGHYSRHSDTTKTSRGVPRSVPRLIGSP